MNLLKTIPCTEYATPPPTDEGVVAILSHIQSDETVRKLTEYPWVLAIHTSDESHEWDLAKLKHPRMKTWMQYPTEKHRGDRNILIGCQEDTHLLMPERKPLKERKYDWVFSGQVNHPGREELVRNLKGNGEIHARTGFAQGDRKEHLRLLTEARIAPCPGGLVHPDSFRFAEAIECGCLPVVDTPEWWESMGVPVKAVSNWSRFPFILDYYQYYPDKLQKDVDVINAWWENYKVQLREWLLEDVKELSGVSDV